MIQKMQRRFIFITMSCISFIFILILLVLNISMTISSRRQGYDMLLNFAQRKVSMDQAFEDASLGENQNAPEDTNAPDNMPVPKELPDFSSNNASETNFAGFDQRPEHNERNNWFNDIRIFSVIYDSEGNIIQISTGSNPDLTEDELSAIADKINIETDAKGVISGYLYITVQTDDGSGIYFLDYTPEKGMSNQLLRTCLWIGLAGILVILIPVIFLSRWVARPVQLAFDKQKQFIADASHELKTPLTIITTNAEVLESSIPGNKWLAHILEQSSRMKLLINNLLELAKLDSYQEKQDFISIDLSKTVKNAALSFESMAFEYEKTFSIEIEDGITMHGNDNSIRQLVTILLDNAFKYSNNKGEIQLNLSTHGEKKQLLVHNTGKGIPVEDQKHIFERFYRSDSSRSRESGGYGLGLSIAQAIVDAHKGHIHVKSDGETYTTFIISFP